LYLKQKGVEPAEPSEFVQVIFRIGQRHEKNHLATFPEVSDLTGKTFAKTLEEIQKGSPVIYQGKLQAQVSVNGQVIEVVGVPDFMIKVPQGYVIRDCKLARRATERDHPEIPRQLQVYGWLYEQTTGNKPAGIEVLKGDSAIESMDYSGEDTVLSYFRSLMDIMSLPEEPYSPVGWSKCGGCGYNKYCMKRAEDNQDVALVYDLDQCLAIRLRDTGVFNIQELLAKHDEDSLSELRRPWGARKQKVGKKAGGILLQAQSMLDKKERILKKPELPVSQNYVMFDLEGLPPQLQWTARVKPSLYI
jgi:predicted RecB family nuclease